MNILQGKTGADGVALEGGKLISKKPGGNYTNIHVGIRPSDLKLAEKGDDVLLEGEVSVIRTAGFRNAHICKFGTKRGGGHSLRAHIT